MRLEEGTRFQQGRGRARGGQGLERVGGDLGGGHGFVDDLVVSVAAWGTGRLPKGLNLLGIASGIAALVTLVPGLSDVGIVFGLGSIAWFAWTGIVLLRTNTPTGTR